MRFGVYTRHYQLDNGQLIQKDLIVLKEGDLIVEWTDFHKFAETTRLNKITPYESRSIKRIRHIVMLLNYAFFDSGYHITSLLDLNAEVVCSFLNDYGMCRLKDDTPNTVRQRKTVKNCVDDILDFCSNIINEYKGLSKLKQSELYTYEKVFSKGSRRYVQKKVLAFKVNFKESPEDHIFRDIRDEDFEIIMSQIVAHHKNILMLAALSAFGGLRPSEACNVRRPDSKLGAGIRFETIGTEITNIYVDIRKELNLRSDYISVGGIKKPRIQKIYPPFIPVFYECYQDYMKYIQGRTYEEEYGPLTLNSQGKAMTYASYSGEFKKVVQECIPIMLSSDDPKVVLYGQLLQENNIGPHILRHWFSMSLADAGLDAVELMNWRGDKCIDSAITYINNKSQLTDALERAENRIFDYSLWKAGKIHG